MSPSCNTPTLAMPVGLRQLPFILHRNVSLGNTMGVITLIYALVLFLFMTRSSLIYPLIETKCRLLWPLEDEHVVIILPRDDTYIFEAREIKIEMEKEKGGTRSINSTNVSIGIIVYGTVRNPVDQVSSFVILELMRTRTKGILLLFERPRGMPTRCVTLRKVWQSSLDILDQQTFDITPLTPIGMTTPLYFVGLLIRFCCGS